MYENWAGDPEVTKFLTWPTHESAEISRQILKEWVAAYDNPEVYQWCIEEKESGEPVGSIAVVSRNEKTQSCEIGNCISRSRCLRRSGYCGWSTDMIRRIRIPERS